MQQQNSKKKFIITIIPLKRTNIFVHLKKQKLNVYDGTQKITKLFLKDFKSQLQQSKSQKSYYKITKQLKCAATKNNILHNNNNNNLDTKQQVNIVDIQKYIHINYYFIFNQQNYFYVKKIQNTQKQNLNFVLFVMQFIIILLYIFNNQDFLNCCTKSEHQKLSVISLYNFKQITQQQQQILTQVTVLYFRIKKKQKTFNLNVNTPTQQIWQIGKVSIIFLSLLNFQTNFFVIIFFQYIQLNILILFFFFQTHD
eukprot:TRINITY_DN7180_c0_g3_i1.p1 TRINITY_DN7180_c0_g3~~TRINITY_DN7180_c0_g3_i1.p1  ORF type:complete len:254 (+),score=-15.03 TRINITY_DN7180_c0_g3_i1:886-1647(+)